MPSEISAWLQAQTNTQTLRNSNSSSDKENSQPGLFDSFMSEYESPEEIITNQNAITDTHDDTAQLITFTGSNSFPQSVIDILADINCKNAFDKGNAEDIQSMMNMIRSVMSGENDSAIQAETEKLLSQFLNDESIPEDEKNKIMNAVDDLLNDLKDSDLIDDGIKSFAVKISELIHEHSGSRRVSASVDDALVESEDTDDASDVDDDNPEMNTASVSAVGAAVILNSDSNSVHSDTVSESDSDSEFPDMNPQTHNNVQGRPVPYEHKSVTQKADAKTQNESETEDVQNETKTANFNERLESSDNENETSNQNQNTQAQSQNQNSNSSGHEENSPEHEQSNGTQTPSRTRNDTRRASNASSRTQDERTDTNSQRTESRNTFQSFFEGVMSSRRNASQSSPLPLDLRAASYSFNQSQTLRDGMINVVRFIRADGVQKANVVVDPPALGRISVELTSGTSGVEASIKVANEQIRQLVQDQLSELRMNLSQQGVQVAEFTVDVQQDNSQNGNHQGSQYSNEQRAFAINEADDDTEEFRIDLEEGLLYWVA